MISQVLCLAQAGIIDTSFLALDSTPVYANTSQNNPKSFQKNKFAKNNKPKADKDCGLGVHTASNQVNERNFEYYWGYKNHALVDCITGLPIFELTTTADVYDSVVALDIINQTNSFLSIRECTFIADKAYDVKAIYNTIKNVYCGECAIPLNKRNTKNPKNFQADTLFVKRDFQCTRTVNLRTMAGRVRNTAALTDSQRLLSVLAIKKIGTTERKTVTVPNTLLFPMITDFR